MKVLIFGGAVEGRKLSEVLSKAGNDVTLSVATEFGREAAAPDRSAVNNSFMILADRLGEEDMISLLKRSDFDLVIDATHPYAVSVTQNIRSACKAAGLEYYRLKRAESTAISGVTYVADVAAAVEILKNSDGNVLLTIGSKELGAFTQVENYGSRFFVRILPMQDSLKKATNLGFRGSNIICMQGPFDREMNTAMLKMTGAEFLVTKDSGDAGGFEAKVSAALSIGCKVIVIARPIQEEGLTFSDLLGVFNIKEKLPELTAFFPLFVDMRNKKVLVIGGGKAAEGRVKKLLPFGADITVISPIATEQIKSAALRNILRLIERKYKNGDITCMKPFFVIAATDDRQANNAAMAEAAGLDIPISVADCREECTFYFPAIAESESYITGLVSKNGDHAGVKRTAERIRGLLNI